MSKSKDLRLSAVLYRLAGHTYSETAKIFHASVSAIRVWVQKYQETGDLSDKPVNRGFKKIDPDKLRTYVKEHPDDTQQEIADAFGCTNQAVSKALKRLKIKTLRYKEQDPEKVAAYDREIADVSSDKIAYVDESGVNSYLYREYGYAPRGEKVFGEIAGRKFQRTNLIAAKLSDKILAPMYYNENTDSAIFELWFEHHFLPTLPKDTVIVMDNATFHRKAPLTELAKDYPVRLLFLPPYSPERNPIEKVWANMKRWLKQHMRDFSSLDDAIEAAWDYVYKVG